LRTCWQRVSQFRQVGNMLRKAYQNAIYATYDTSSGKLLRSAEAFFGNRILISDDSVLSGVSAASDEDYQSRWKDTLKWLVVNQAGNAHRQHPWQNSRPKRSHLLKQPMLMDEDIQRSRERSLKRYKNMLVYLESSPDYCNVDPDIGHLGIAGRQCNAEAADSPNSCDHICCGRGYETTEMETQEKCDCKFVWCCEVKCRVCRHKTLVHRCKRSQDDERLTQHIQQLWNVTPVWRANQLWEKKGYYIEAFH
uniref:Protein Wnt n=1 Tax=Schistocephalus solidus TaxID=70667 RepID=A0A183SYU0_SCHSO